MGRKPLAEIDQDNEPRKLPTKAEYKKFFDELAANDTENDKIKEQRGECSADRRAIYGRAEDAGIGTEALKLAYGEWRKPIIKEIKEEANRMLNAMGLKDMFNLADADKEAA